MVTLNGAARAKNERRALSGAQGNPERGVFTEVEREDGADDREAKHASFVRRFCIRPT